MASTDRSTAATVLERRCRLLLLAYPPQYRAERGDEILATLLDCVPPGRRAPSLADSADLVSAGLRRRLGTATMAGFESGLTLAAPVALALAAGISAFAWWRVEPLSDGGYMGGQPFLGAFRTLGPIAYAAWLLAAIGWVPLRMPARRLLIAVAVVVTVALPVAAPLTTVDRPPLWVTMALVVFGLLALGGTAPALAPPRHPLDSRLAVPAGAVAVAVGASTVSLLWTPRGMGFGYYYQPTIARVGTVITAAVAVIAAIAIVRQVRRRGAADWLWATALLGLPAGWLGPFDTAGLRVAAQAPVPHFGRLAQVLLATCLAATALAWLAQRRTGSGAPRPSGTAGVAALGSAAGLALFLAFAHGGQLGFAPAPGQDAVPAYVLLGVVALAAAGMAVAVAAPTGPAHRALGLGGVCAGATVVASWLVAAYDNGWTAAGWPDVGHTASLVVTLVLLPLSACADVAVRVFLARGSGQPFALAALVVSVGWIGYAALPYVLSWGPVLFVLIICAAAVALSRRS